MTYLELREKFQKFFESIGHKFLSSAPLVPENDPSTLFTTAGMQPLVPYLLGEKHPEGNRLANIQKCIRTGDIDEVGDNSHLTFFEMLGNWSLGDYFKKESISWSWEFLTDPKWLGLDKDKFAVSVFGGDEDNVFDEESYNIWKNLGVSEKRIAKLDKSENWWPAGGKMSGPQGPDTEIFYWVGDPSTSSGQAIPEEFDPENDNWMEVWNNVFMEYNKGDDGEMAPLTQKNIDTGMGMERMLKVVQNKNDIFETELFLPIIKNIYQYIHKSSHDLGYLSHERSIQSVRIIADHLRASVFMLSEKLEISNTGAGYILRRLIRRAIRYGNLIGIRGRFLSEVAESVFKIYSSIYPEIEKNKKFILSELEKEEEKFGKTLERGLKEFNDFVLRTEPRDGRIGVAHMQNILYGKDAFYLYQTFGFPKELMMEICSVKGIKFDEKGFDEELEKHQQLSKTASAGMFKGGLGGGSEMEIKYHTATHLLQAALRKVLGEGVEQRGSNITPERLRFDFSYGEKMNDQQKEEVEGLVNGWIKEGLEVKREEMDIEEAKKSGAIGIFDDKYGDRVSVYTIANPSTGSGSAVSREFCGGPHVENISQLGVFKIKKEESASSGVRRIKAILI